MVHHTFLCEEGLWRASGIYINAAGHKYPVEGEARIIHLEDRWLNESVMILGGDRRVEYLNHYEVAPLEPGKDLTTWVSDNPSLGVLSGKFVIVEESILSIYQSANRIYSGVEILLKKDDVLYGSWGTLFNEGQKISSWSVALKRQA